MPRLGLKRRPQSTEPALEPEPLNTTEETPPIEPFVPVDPAGFDAYDKTPAPVLESSEVRATRHLLRPHFDWTLRLDVLLLALALIAGGITGTLILQDRLDVSMNGRWAAALLALAGLWMLLALLRRQVTSFLGGATLAGVGLALLMDVQDIAAFDETVLGVVLVTVGLGIVVRGLVMHPTA